VEPKKLPWEDLLPKREKPSSLRLAPRGVPLPSPITGRTTTSVSLSVPIKSDESAVPQLLLRKGLVPAPDQITVAQIAADLGVETDRIQPLIDRGYLRVMIAGETLETTIVARPLPAAMAWLSTMFVPLRMRPMLPAGEVATFLQLSAAAFRSYAIHYNIPVYDDPVFGELITLASLYAFQQALYDERSVTRYDRQTMLAMMCKKNPVLGRTKYTAYSKKIEAEIMRISHMEEPDRTMRAVAFWTAYRDAETVYKCLEDYEGTVRELTPWDLRQKKKVALLLKWTEMKRKWGDTPRKKRTKMRKDKGTHKPGWVPRPKKKVRWGKRYESKTRKKSGYWTSED